jgi:hypothetical protein
VLELSPTEPVKLGIEPEPELEGNDYKIEAKQFENEALNITQEPKSPDACIDRLADVIKGFHVIKKQVEDT